MVYRRAAESGVKRISAGFAHVPKAPAPALALLGSDGSILAWGEGCWRLLGNRAADVVGRPVRELLAASAEPASWSSAPGALEQCGGRQSVGGVVDVKHADGGSLRLTVEIVALTGEGGERCWFVAVTDARDGAGNVEAEAVLLDRSPLAVGVWDTDMRLV